MFGYWGSWGWMMGRVGFLFRVIFGFGFVFGGVCIGFMLLYNLLIKFVTLTTTVYIIQIMLNF